MKTRAFNIVGAVVALTLLVVYVSKLSASTTVRVWGKGTYGADTSKIPPSGLTDVTAIAAAFDHCLALKSDGTVVAWGSRGEYGQYVTNVPSPVTNVVALAAGDSYNLALRADGSLVAWGHETGTELMGLLQVPPQLTNIVEISVGWDSRRLVLTQDGVVDGWGYYNCAGGGQDLSNVKHVVAGMPGDVAIKSDGTLAYWCNTSLDPANHPPEDLTNVVSVSAGREHFLALLSDKTVRSWGQNGFTNVPVGLDNIVAVSAGWGSSIALRADGTVVSWGYVEAVPVDLTNVVAICSGQGFWMALVNSEPVVQPRIKVDAIPAITMFVPVGSMCRIEYRGTLDPMDQWMQLATLLITNTPQVYVDLSALGQPQRFYRLLQFP